MTAQRGVLAPKRCGETLRTLKGRCLARWNPFGDFEQATGECRFAIKYVGAEVLKVRTAVDENGYLLKGTISRGLLNPCDAYCRVSEYY